MGKFQFEMFTINLNYFFKITISNRAIFSGINSLHAKSDAISKPDGAKIDFFRCRVMIEIWEILSLKIGNFPAFLLFFLNKNILFGDCFNLIVQYHE